MIDKNILNDAKSWEMRARTDNDPFTKLHNLWTGFNPVLRAESQKHTEREMIDWLKTGIAINDANELVQAYMFSATGDPFEKDVESLIKLCPLTNMKNHNQITIADINDRTAIVDVIYTVRCNFQHGNKNANNAQDQQWVTLVARLVEKWLHNYINKAKAA